VHLTTRTVKNASSPDAEQASRFSVKFVEVQGFADEGVREGLNNFRITDLNTANCNDCRLACRDRLDAATHFDSIDATNQNIDN